VGKPYGWYLTDLPKQADALLEWKEGVLGPIRRFMGGPQKALYDEASAYLTRQTENFTYAGAERAEAIRSELADPACFKGGVIQKLKSELEALQADVGKALAAERADGEAQVAGYRTNLHALQEWSQVPAAEQSAIDAEFEAALKPFRSTDLIGIARGRLADFKASVYPRLLERAVRAATPPAPEPAPAPAPGFEEPTVAGFTPPPQPSPPPAPLPKKTQFVPVGALQVKYSKPFLADEADVGAYLETLRETLLTAIRDGKRITL
jgi:hypothetical protein